MAASSCGAVGVPNSILWAKMVVVDARLRAGGGAGGRKGKPGTSATPTSCFLGCPFPSFFSFFPLEI